MEKRKLEKGLAPVFLMVIILALVISGGAIYYNQSSKTVSSPTPNSTPEAMEKDAVMTSKPRTPSPTSGDEPGTIGPRIMSYSGTVLAGTNAKLLDFSKADYDAAFKTHNLIVLYFYANWCLICRAEFPRHFLYFERFDRCTTGKMA